MLGLPLGLGKANTIANAIFHRVARDPSLHLHIFTALTLEAPRPRSALEQRFLQPVIDRTMGGYPPLAYAAALRAGTLPANIEVNEFFFLAGRWLSVARAQQSYISANYTHAARYLVERGVNVIAQLVAKKKIAGRPHFSLSCNTDLTLDALAARTQGRTGFLLVGEVNAELPFMPGEADVPIETFSDILDDGTGGFPLFAPPKEPVGLREHAIGLHAARLVVDGGTLQLGIGQESDATVHALMLRQTNNARFRHAVSALRNGRPPLPLEENGVFDHGLYGVSEMFVDGFLALMKAGILKREVDGALLHAAFFLGTRDFYRALREMPDADLDRLHMRAVSFTNELGCDENRRRARTKARFINSTMMATLLGAVVSDGLEDGRVVSGVGGQYNFVAQAFELDDARSILTFKSTRGAGSQEQSNVRWTYGHETVPRHLRDIVVNEYGVADLRGRSDAEVIAAMLAITDSRFQPELLRLAKEAGKIASTYEIPSAFRENFPERVTLALKPFAEEGLLPSFPLGTDLDEAEQKLAGRLQILATADTRALLRLALKGIFARDASMDRPLARMGLLRPSGIADRIYGYLLRGVLAG